MPRLGRRGLKDFPQHLTVDQHAEIALMIAADGRGQDEQRSNRLLQALGAQKLQQQHGQGKDDHAKHPKRLSE